MSPLKGFICPKGTECEGRQEEFGTCLAQNHENCLPYPIRRAIADTQSERSRWFTPSQISMCLRKAKWSITKDYYEPPMSCYAAMRGNLIHDILERASDDGSITEETVSRKIEGTDVEIRGTFDRFKDGILYDYKTQKDLGFKIFKTKPYAKEMHIWQVNIYRWMMLPKYDVKDIKMIYLGLGNIAVTGEHIQYDDWGRESGFDMDPCPVYTEEKVYNYLKAKADVIEKMENPPADSSLGWLCKVCAFRDECYSMESKHPF